MIKPNTPVRCRDDVGGSSGGVHYYIGLCRSGRHVVESDGMFLQYWDHVEPLPRELQPGDSVYASVGRIGLNDHDLYTKCIFDGMYKDEFVCIQLGAKRVFKYAVFAEEVESNDD